MRVLILIPLLILAAPVASGAGTAGFAGNWSARICPPGSRNAAAGCSTFVLELHQNGNRICGAHVFSTADASKMDEGAAPSVMGEANEGTAEVVVVSTRSTPSVRIPGRLRMQAGRLHWERLANPPGDYLVPAAAQLSRASRGSFLAPLFAQELRAACTAVPLSPPDPAPLQTSDPLK